MESKKNLSEVGVTKLTSDGMEKTVGGLYAVQNKDGTWTVFGRKKNGRETHGGRFPTKEAALEFGRNAGLR